MVDMDKKEQILHYHRIDGLSQREIARRVGVCRKTVKRYITEYEAQVQSDPEDGANICLASKPKYPSRKVECTRMTDAVRAEIDYWLEENAKRRLTGMRKQCLKRQDIHLALIEKGFSISYSSVCKYIQKRKEEKTKKPKDVFIRQYYEPGQECEFDWGEVKLRIGGKPVTFTMAVFALCHSEGRWAYLFRHQDNLAFMESHRNFFHDVHGVPHTMVYDNMKVAVILKPDGKKPTETLLRMCAFYGFGYRFCNARAGWEKGHVERSVDFVRGRAFTRRVDFNSIEDAQQWLSHICDILNRESGSIATGGKREALRRDLDSMLRFPGDFGCFDLLQCAVDKQSTISVKNSHYSVPDHLVGQTVIVQLYSEKIRVYDSAHKKMAEHERSYSTGSWTFDINHYINTLMKKPGALKGSVALRQMPENMRELFRVHFADKDNGKDFLHLLKYCRENKYDYKDILDAVRKIRMRGARHITFDQIKVVLETRKDSPLEFEESQKTDAFIEIELGSEDVLAQLDGIMQGTAGGYKNNERRKRP